MSSNKINTIFNSKLNLNEWEQFFGNDFSKDEKPLQYASDKYTFVEKANQIGTLHVDDAAMYVPNIPIFYLQLSNTKITTRTKISQFLQYLIMQNYDYTSALAFIEYTEEEYTGQYRLSYIKLDRHYNDQTGKFESEKSNPKRFTFVLGEGIPSRTAETQLKAESFTSIANIEKAFSVEPVTKAFYAELSDWYAWAVKVARFPNAIKSKKIDSEEDIYNTEAVIRLITRLIFVWFLKQKSLIPNEFFEEDYIAQNLIEGFNPHVQATLFGKCEESKYYKAILQNLFFAMLNCPIEADKETITSRAFRNGRNDFDNNKLMRYESYFKNPQLFVELANKHVPFLNGGLFDCIDDKANENYLDGFSDRDKVGKLLIVPDYLFFGEEAGKNIDLSDFYGDKNKKKVSARGIIDILKQYNFTIEENTPFDQEISLDPELLGKVFENLLASFNPETKTTARKQTGSFYTPREIVQYMVDESLIAHLKRTCGESDEESYRKLMNYSDDEIALDATKKKAILHSLYTCKILDPACGSGAFPMGILQQMVHILSRLDPTNEVWKEILLNDVMDETKDAYKNSTEEEREEIITDINRSFNDSLNRPDYARKLYLIENCIFGVDIQSIAVQISKLRFFISLVVDQKANKNAIENFGIRPLPNLEAKFIAANTLIGLQKTEAELFDNPRIKEIEEDLKLSKHKIFSCKTYKTKRKHQEKINVLRNELSTILVSEQIIGQDQAQQLANWDMFDQHASAPFFDSEWMFGIKEGFDVVIGNPPYGAKTSATDKKYYEEKYEVAKTIKDLQKGSTDTFTIFINQGYNILCKNGVLIFIVPMAVTSSDSMTALHNLLEKNCKTIQISSYSNRPKQVFDSACIRTSILLFNKTLTATEEVLTSKLVRRSQDVSIQDLIDNLTFIDSYKYKLNGRYPKIGSESELKILEKMFSTSKKLGDYQKEMGNAVYYRTSGGRYFNVITLTPTGSSKENYFNVSNATEIAICLSSSLFWFYQQIYTNGLDLKQYEILNFPVPHLEKIDKETISKINNLAEVYYEDIEKNALVREAKSYNVSSFKEYKIRKSKHIIDKIDDLICPLYGLSKEQTNFIKNYEIEYRVNDE